jgi:hypothetical protein
LSQYIADRSCHLSLPFYQDKLHEETVYKRFNEILVKARSNKLGANKPEAELKEFEMILAEHKVKGEEDQALAADAVKKTAKAARRRAGKPVPGSPVKRRPSECPGLRSALNTHSQSTSCSTPESRRTDRRIGSGRG